METAEPIVVVAHWRTTQASLDTVLAHTAVLRPQSLAEPGCLGYEVFQVWTNPPTLCASSVTATEPHSRHT